MKKFKLVVEKNKKIKEVTKLMSDYSLNNGIFGIAVVVDKSNQVIGSLSDGDIRKYITKSNNLDVSIEGIYNKNPITIVSNGNKKSMYNEAVEKISIIQKTKKNFFLDKIIIVNEDKTFNDVLLLHDLNTNILDKRVSVYGMGFVGLTLGLVMASKGFKVTGVDVNKTVIEDLKISKPHFFENGLESLLETCNSNNLVSFSSDFDDVISDVYIIAVGTPLNKENNANLSYINSITKSLIKKIKEGDLIIYRSTLPIGTVRKIIIPTLEESGLECGSQFHVSYAPERTIEGKAIEEVQSLPQIIGGFSSKCKDLTSNIFKEITSTIVEVDSLEAAEMVKLLNNTYRDLVFSFANEVSNICEQYNLNAFNLIEAANEGYPRNPIPKPSPGIGGICLSKDPYLYTNSSDPLKYVPILGKASRQINKNGGNYVFEKIQSYCKEIGKDINELKITIFGLAFKGTPETSDIRESMAVKLIEELPNKHNIYVKDFVVSKEDISRLNVNYVDDLETAFARKDVILFMNNHYMNNKFDYFKYISLMNNSPLVFDGWNLFRANEIERINDSYYATMGYMTDK